MNPTFPCELHSTVYRQRQSKKGQNKVRRLLTPKTLVRKITEHKILKIFKESSVTQLVDEIFDICLRLCLPESFMILL